MVVEQLGKNLRCRVAAVLYRGIASQLLLGAAAIALATSGCGSSGAYYWVDEAPSGWFVHANDVSVVTGDVLSVRVFGQEPLSSRSTVRPDGKITLPLIGEVIVAGKLPNAIAKEIESRLVPFVTTPNVVVVLEESKTRIVVLGEVRRVGAIVLERGEDDVLSALAAAGGLTEFADESQIFVLRTDNNRHYRIRFCYGDIVRGDGRSAEFRLKNGDRLVVQ